MKQKFYSIQGFIFQEGNILAVGIKSGASTSFNLEKAMIRAMFNSIVGPSEEENVFCGNMSDIWGDSEIKDFKINTAELSFTKYYANRPPIFYSFKKDKSNIWIGGYFGDDCGEGISKCLVSEIDESFFRSE